MSGTTILLVTLNSTYQHTAFGLRYLRANLGHLKDQSQILEFTTKETPRNVAEEILKRSPRVVGFGIYIWNTLETLEIIQIIKRVAPEVVIVLGGPEISYETETQPHVKYADFIIKGEADFQFRELCEKILNGQNPVQKIIEAVLPDIKQIQLPYNEITDSDLANRYIYVEASRGCPYKCEYCLSSLDKSVRSFDLEIFLKEMTVLIERGARNFKFVDRTFNLSPTTSTQILSFFLNYIDKGLFLHFELVPDRLPTEIRDLIKKFPAGSLQFEIGLQTLNPEVAKAVSRKNDLLKVAENFHFLKNETLVHTHADLIAGLPGENLASFAEGFDRLWTWGPDEIQVGILKRLKGTPISRHETTYKLIYNEKPPYQIVSTSTLNFFELQTMARFSKYWDLYANSGDFKNFLLWCFSTNLKMNSPFWTFYHFSNWISQDTKETYGMSLISQAEKAYRYMISQNEPEPTARAIVEKDYCFGPKRRDLPPFLKNQIHTKEKSTATAVMNKRQLSHLT